MDNYNDKLSNSIKTKLFVNLLNNLKFHYNINIKKNDLKYYKLTEKYLKN